MSSSTSTTTSPIAQLRARFQRLATEPRVKLLPEGPQIVLELVGLIEVIDELDLRIRSLERAMQGLMRGEDFGCDDS